MNGKKHSRLWLIVGILSVLIISGIIIYFLTRSDETVKDEGADYLNNEVDFACLVYGDKYNMGELNHERVTSIDTDTVLRDNDYVYLLMFDMSGEGHITKEDAFRLVKLADENTNFNFFYVGRSAMEYFQEARGQTTAIVPDNLVLGYCFERVGHFGSVGLWTESDMNNPNCIPEDDIPQVIELVMLSIVKENEK